MARDEAGSATKAAGRGGVGPLAMSVDAYAAMVARLPLPRVTVEIPVANAAQSSLVLAQPAMARESQPAWDQSAMDGYAVRSTDVEQAMRATPVTLHVAAEVAAGSTAAPQVEMGQAVRIMTGAPVPPGADAVVRVEDTDGDFTQRFSEHMVCIKVPARPGDNVRVVGSDVAQGSQILAAGQRVTAASLPALIGSGVDGVSVWRPVHVGVLATGAELVTGAGADTGIASFGNVSGGALARGQIRETNAHMVAAQLADVANLQVKVCASDDVATVLAALDQLVDEGAELLVTTGGLSAGAYEVVRLALADHVTVVRVAMQPGGPQACGSYRDVPVVCLPGTPTGAFVGCEVFLKPLLSGADQSGRWVPLPYAGRERRVRQGRDQWIPMVWDATQGGLIPASGGSLAQLAAATHVARVERSASAIHAGDLLLSLALR